MSEVTIPLTTENNIGHSLENQSPVKKWLGLGILSLGLAIVIIDTTLLNVSLSTIIKDLKTDLVSLQWVITSYALVLAALTITGGRLGDIFGRKKMFMFGAIIFAIGSFIASISTSVPILLLGESIIEGIGAALMMPATASLVVANFTGKERAMAFGIWGAVAGASSALGPLLGGYLTSHYSWRWGFRINVFVAIIVIIGAILLIKESLDEKKPGLDWLGVILSSLGLFSLVFGIIESPTYGWLKAKAPFEIFGHSFLLGGISIVPIAIILGLLILTFFVWRESRFEHTGHSPLVSIDMFKNRQFTSGVITISIMSLGMTGMVFALPIFLQTVKNLDALHTGLALLPMSLAIFVVAPIVGFLSRKIEPRIFIWAGLFINMLAAFLIRATINENVTITQLIPGLSFYGLGMAMVFAPISNIILSAVPISMSGEASGVNNTLRQVGGSLGAAIIGAAIFTSLSGHLSLAVQNSPVIPEQAKQAIVQQISKSSSSIEFGGAALPQNTPQEILTEMKTLVAKSAAAATQDAYVYSALFSFIGLLVALFLPKMHSQEDTAPEDKVPVAPYKYVFAFLAAFLGIGAAGLILNHSSKQILASGVTSQISMAEIKNAFPPLTPPPAQNNQAATSTQNTVVPTPSPTPTPVFDYKDNSIGLEIKLMGAWQSTTASDGSVAIVNSKGETINIQAYQTQDDLNAVKSELSGSASVSGLTQITYKNLPALSFLANNQKAVAFIYKNKLYYIFNVNLIDENNLILY